MSLSESFNKIMNNFNYVRRSPKSPSEKTPELTERFKIDDYGEEAKKWKSDTRMTAVKRRELVLESPFFIKATKKKNLDCFRAWFEFENINTRKPPSVIDAKIIELFNRRADPRFKFFIAGICADIYGDGFILKKYENDILLKDGTIDYESPPPKGAKLRNLKLINPEHLKEIKLIEGKKRKYYEKLGIEHFYYNNKTLEIYIHPKRVIHIMDDQLPFTKLGISKVDILRNIITSEKGIDIACGEILKWFSHGIQEFTKENGMSPNERKEILNIMGQHPNYYANSDKYKLTIHNPTAIDPKNFYDYVVLTFAAVFVMPTQVLTGVQIGRTAGAETGYSDYYRDVKDKQDLIYSPHLLALYEEVLRSEGKEFKYEILWNDIFVGEQAEAELMGKRSAYAVNLKNSGIIDNAEARDLINSGRVYLDPNKKIEQEEPDTTKDDLPKTPNRIVKSPKKPDNKTPKSNIYQKRMAMIEKRKILEQADKEKILGNTVMKEQDDLFGKEE